MLPYGGKTGNSRHAAGHVSKQRYQMVTFDRCGITSEVKSISDIKTEIPQYRTLKKKMGKLFHTNGPTMANNLTTTSSNTKIDELEKSLYSYPVVDICVEKNMVYTKQNMEPGWRCKQLCQTAAMDCNKYKRFHPAFRQEPHCAWNNFQSHSNIHNKSCQGMSSRYNVGVKFNFTDSNDDLSKKKRNFLKKREHGNQNCRSKQIREFIDTDWRARKKPESYLHGNECKSRNEVHVNLVEYAKKNEGEMHCNKPNDTTVNEKSTCNIESEFVNHIDKNSECVHPFSENEIMQDTEKETISMQSSCDSMDSNQENKPEINIIDWFDNPRENVEDNYSEKNTNSVNGSACNVELSLKAEVSSNVYSNTKLNSVSAISREDSVCSDIFEQSVEETSSANKEAASTCSSPCIPNCDSDDFSLSDSEKDGEKCKEKVKSVSTENAKPPNKTCSTSKEQSFKNDTQCAQNDMSTGQYILYIRKGYKKCRPSSKKRQRKSHQEMVSIPSNKQETSAKEETHSKQKQKSNCSKNKLFILSYQHPKNSKREEEPVHHSFFFTCEDDDDSDLEFSSDSECENVEDDEICTSFVNPLSLSVLIHCGDRNSNKHLNEQESAEETHVANVKAANLRWNKHIDDTILCSKKSSPKDSMKKVHFPPEKQISTVHPMITWSFAYKQARIGDWKQTYLDRQRFQDRVKEMEKMLAPIFCSEKRAQVYASLKD